MTNIRRRKQFRFTSPEGSAFMTELQYTFFLGSHTTDRFRFYEITTDEAGMTEDLVQRLIQLHYDPVTISGCKLPTMWPRRPYLCSTRPPINDPRYRANQTTTAN